MKKNCPLLSLIVVLAAILPGCVHVDRGSQSLNPAVPPAVARALESVRAKYAPDSHLAIFNVAVEQDGERLVLVGEVDNPEARTEAIEAVRRAGYDVQERIAVLPAAHLGDAVWGIAALSVVNGREKPGHKEELGTQILMGHTVRVWKQATNWFLVQSADGYLAWVQKGTIFRCSKTEADAWGNASRLIVTAFEDRVLESPHADALPVSDVVTGCLVRKTGEEGNWFKVELPDRRAGHLPGGSVMDYDEWKRSRRATPESIERAAKMLLGRPYLWGGNSPKGLDCSGFTKLVFFLNGIDLNRNASHQAQQGSAVQLDPDLTGLRKGDLVFFGSRGGRGRPERVTHVGIYLGEGLFIHASELVRINSLDSQSPLRDERRIRTLFSVRRILGD